MQDLSEKLAWQERWSSGRTGWDQGGAHPSLGLLISHAKREGGLPDGGRFYSAGAGRAHSEAVLAQAGYQVRAIDLSAEAVDWARNAYASATGLELRIGDFFDIKEDERESFDAVYDRAMLCALGPGVREAYLASMKDRLKPGGLFCGILFRSVRGSHPPYPVDEAEAMRLFHKDFQLCFASAIPAAPEPVGILEEWICVWRKRGDA